MTPTTTATTPAATWIATLGQLEMLVTRANYDTWLRDTIGLRQEDERFVVGAQSDFATEWLATRLRPLITKTLARVLGHAVDVSFEVVRPGLTDAPVLLSEPDGATEVPAFLRRSVAPPALNAALTFETFVVGEENALAFESARKVVQQPGMTNPLTIIGPCGLGKTHLLEAIGHAAWATGLSVIYAPAERFGNDYARANRDNGYEQFRNRYRNVDVLLIDDVQFFEGRQGFQEAFFHAFNDLHSAGKQICVSSDRAPAQLTGIIEPLRSRLQWGLVADLQRPAFETRLAILRAKSLRHAVRLPDEALELIAEHYCPTVRELEGFLNRVLAYIPLVGGKVTREIIERALSPLAPAAVSQEAAAPSADVIVAAVCRRMGTQPADLRGKSRSRDVAYARHLAMYVLKEDGRKTVAEIGRLFGNRDHSTVLAGIQRIALEQTTRPETRADVSAVRAAVAAAGDAGAVAVAV